MDDASLGLLALLLALLALSAFFSGAETALMGLNRYRLRHLASTRHRGARWAAALLQQPDRTVGLMLLCSTLANVAAAAVATLLAIRLLGHGRSGWATLVAILVIAPTLLIFGKVLPKTLAALRTEQIAFPAALVLKPLLHVSRPFIWLANATSRGLLNLFGVQPDDAADMPLSREELRMIVKEAGAIISRRHQQILYGILDLERATVEDIMVPRAEIVGVNLEDKPADIEEQLASTRHTRLPVYRGHIDNIVGILHVRKLPRLYEDMDHLDVAALESILAEPYFVPAGTPLHTQLLAFQRQRERMGLVVDEYGDIEGLVTLEDLLEEIVSGFLGDRPPLSKEIIPQPDGTYLVDGSVNLRELNRRTGWKLPLLSSKTLNGLILETLESIPEPGTTLRIGGHTIEILQMSGQAVKLVRVTPVLDIAPLSDAKDAADNTG